MPLMSKFTTPVCVCVCVCEYVELCSLSDEEEDDEMDFSGVKTVNLQVSIDVLSQPTTLFKPSFCLHTTHCNHPRVCVCVCVCV